MDMIADGMRKRIASLVAATFVLASCGGGGSGNGVAGIDRTGVPVIASYGTVSAFGSVVVNGVHYDTNQATFTIDDNPGVSTDLAIGHVVLVRGTLNANRATGVAASVSFENNVAGPVTSIDLVANTAVVLGQLVRVSAHTSFAPGIQPRSLAGIAVGDILDIPARRVTSLLSTMSKVTIARVNGFCFTGALELAIACDLVLIAAEAKLVDNKFSAATIDEIKSLFAGLTDPQLTAEASKLVEQLDGEVSLQSEFGVGTSVSVVIPQAISNLTPSEYWSILLFKDLSNYGGVKEQGNRMVSQKWDIALHLPPAI